MPICRLALHEDLCKALRLDPSRMVDRIEIIADGRDNVVMVRITEVVLQEQAEALAATLSEYKLVRTADGNEA